jgi:acyl-CoA thioesterase
MRHSTDIHNEEAIIQIIHDLPPDVRTVALQALEAWAERDPHTGPLGWLLGLHYVERAPGRTRCYIDVGVQHHNPGHIAHGGIAFTLADSAMGAAVYTLLEPGQRTATIELKINYLAPVVEGRTTATATVVTKRRHTAVVTAEVHDQHGELIAIAQGTFAIIHPSPPPPQAIEGDA